MFYHLFFYPDAVIERMRARKGSRGDPAEHSIYYILPVWNLTAGWKGEN